MWYPFNSLPIHWFWVAMVIILSLIEVFTLGLTTIWFAIGALVLVFLSLWTNIPFQYQLLIFLVISAVLLVFTRPIAIKKMKLGREKTNVDSFAGKIALVVKPITEFEKGEVKVSGQIWSARAEGNAEIPEGTKCKILRVEGVQLIVCKLEEE